jgi:LysR family hydrogen peroxide-inducible transcriptional activator
MSMDETRVPASSMPTLRQLQFLLAVRKEGSFVAAAEAVGVTQPSLSAGIKELETALGAVLIERGRSGAVLTTAGEEAAERAARALQEVEDLVRAVRSAGQPFSGLFRLGAIPTIAPFLLPRIMPALKQRYPRLRLHLREDLTSRLVEGLRARSLDAAIIALPYSAHGVATIPVAEDEFLLACPRKHPLAAREALSPEDLKAEELLLLEDGHCLREHALSACRLASARGSAEVSATSLHTLVQMVSSGMGVTLLPKLAADGGAAAGANELTLKRFAEPLVGRSIGVAWREGAQREEEEARLLAELLRTVVSATESVAAR